MTEPTYKNVTATVRTPRCAILIDENSPYWKAAVDGSIMHASEVWGGRYFLLIPTDGTRIKNKFWEILEAYSPDHVATYTMTVADMAIIDPERYVETKERYRKQFEAQGFTTGFERLFAKDLAASEISMLTISENLERELLERLSPFHFHGRAAREHLSRRAGFGFPFTKVADIITYARRDIGKVTLPKAIDDPTLALLIHSQTGLASTEYQAALAKAGLTVTKLPDEYDTGEFLEHVLGSQSPVRHTGADHWSPADEYMQQTPFGLSMLHLGQYYQIDRHREDIEPLVVIIGDTVDDFCLYYSLSRLHERVCWLPLAWLRSSYRAVQANRRRHENGDQPEELNLEQKSAQRLANLFFQLVDYGHHGKRIQLRSMSLNVKQLAAYRRQMATCSYFASELQAVTDCLPVEQPSTACILRAFEENNYINHRSVIFVAGETVSPFDTPKPKNFSQIVPPRHYWITSLRIEGYGPPSLPTLGVKCVNIHNVTVSSRVANDGIAYQCPNFAYFGGDIDVNLIRPKIRMPDELAMFGEYFGGIGVTIRYSDKGNYVMDTLTRFGGLSEVGKFIKAPTTRSILDKFMLKSGLGDGSVVFLTNDQRAYLNLEALNRSVGGETQAADLADDLVGRRILQRGHILQCERCRLSSWYGLDALSTEFSCNRCSFRQQFTRAHWKQPVEPHWYYRLAETVYQFYRHNSHLTVQVLYKLQSESKYAFHYVPEIELIDFPSAGEKRELDVACIADGQIIVGECKTEPLQPKDASKFDTLVARIGSVPARIVFATNRGLDSLTDDFKTRVGRLPNSTILTFGDLYDG